MSKRKSQTDWKRVKAIKESDPIPYSAEDGPYDPNQAKATKAYLSGAIIRRPGQRGKQKSATKQLVSLRLSPSSRVFQGYGSGVADADRRGAEESDRSVRNLVSRLRATGSNSRCRRAISRLPGGTAW